LQYLHEGKIFAFQMPGGRGGLDEKRPLHLEHFWLCGECASSKTLEQDAAGKVRPVEKLSDIREWQFR
jgi:hypothetical protein